MYSAVNGERAKADKGVRVPPWQPKVDCRYASLLGMQPSPSTSYDAEIASEYQCAGETRGLFLWGRMFRTGEKHLQCI